MAYRHPLSVHRRRLVLRCLEAFGERGATDRDVERVLGNPAFHVTAALRDLARKGQVVRVGPCDGRRGPLVWVAVGVRGPGVLV